MYPTSEVWLTTSRIYMAKVWAREQYIYGNQAKGIGVIDLEYTLHMVDPVSAPFIIKPVQKTILRASRNRNPVCFCTMIGRVSYMSPISVDAKPPRCEIKCLNVWHTLAPHNCV